MAKIFWLGLLLGIVTGCANNHYINEKMELDDAAKAKRYKELEQILGKLKPGDEVSLLLFNGDTTEGIFYSYLDGFVSLRMDDAFRDTELADVRGISIQPKDRMKAVTMGLIFASIAGIVITFIVTH